MYLSLWKPKKKHEKNGWTANSPVNRKQNLCVVVEAKFERNIYLNGVDITHSTKYGLSFLNLCATNMYGSSESPSSLARVNE